jgi:hypothetical protein
MEIHAGWSEADDAPYGTEANLPLPVRTFNRALLFPTPRSSATMLFAMAFHLRCVASPMELQTYGC